MPITQNRMLALITAAQDYRQALEQLCDIIAAQGEQEPPIALSIITSSAKPFLLLADPIVSGETLVLESMHFKTNQKRNARKARKMAENRYMARGGLPPIKRTTAPQSIKKRVSSGASPIQLIHAEAVAGGVAAATQAPLATSVAASASERMEAAALEELEGDLDDIGSGLSDMQLVKISTPPPEADRLAGDTYRKQMEFVKGLEEEGKGPKAGQVMEKDGS